MSAPNPPALTRDEWEAEAVRRFGNDPLKWRFVCPSCAYVAAVADWKAAGAPEASIAFSCVGRWAGGEDSKTFRSNGGPCMYAGGGLFAINPQAVILSKDRTDNVFAFAADTEGGSHD